MSFNFNNNESDIIELWVEEKGRRTDTYIHGWNIDNDLLKNHLKNIKKKKGCNGSIKELVKETGVIKVMHLQGNVKNFVFSYLVENGIDSEKIIIKI